MPLGQTYATPTALESVRAYTPRPRPSCGGRVRSGEGVGAGGRSGRKRSGWGSATRGWCHGFENGDRTVDSWRHL